MTQFDFSPQAIAALARADVQRALSEDVGSGDLTAGLIDPSRRARARVLVRESAVLCGSAWASAAVNALDPTATITWKLAEGAQAQADQVVLQIEGQAQALLTAERTALNFLQLLSAVATHTATFVKAIHDVPGNRAVIVDTRKTLPGLRLAQNHSAAAGGVREALERAQGVAAQAQFIEIEVETLAQLDEALTAGARMVLLDNMTFAQMREAVALNAGRAILEVSGGVNMGTVREIAATGVDRISVGALTKDVRATDFSMRFEDL